MPNTAVAAAPIAKITFQPLKAQRLFKPRHHRFIPWSKRMNSPVAGLNVSAGKTESFWIMKPSRRIGGKVYVNCTTQTAAINPLKFVMLGTAEQITNLSLFNRVSSVGNREEYLTQGSSILVPLLRRISFRYDFARAGIRRGQFQHSCKVPWYRYCRIYPKKKNMN